MVDRLKPWSALFTVIALVYFAWSAWYEPPVKKAERARMPEVAQSNVQTRDSRETPARLGDPCRLDRDGSRAPASRGCRASARSSAPPRACARARPS